MTPNVGHGTSQSFQFVASDTAGNGDLLLVEGWFTPSSASNLNTCLIYYGVSSQLLYLASDDVSSLSSATIGTTGVLQNSQCTVDVGSAMATPSGNNLILAVTVTFKAGFAPGTKQIWMYAEGATSNSGWVQRGTWTPQTNPGGSNFAWYGPPGVSCFSPACFAPYGVIPNYDVASPAIDAALSQMYANGQRSMRIPIYHNRGNSNCTGPEGRGTTMDSTGGSLQTQCLTNLINFLASVGRHGFHDVEIGFFPQAYNDPRWPTAPWPATWSGISPYEDYYQENLALIKNLRPIFAASGLNYKIDLYNEGVLTSASEFRNIGLYAQRMWADYNAGAGKADTIGFSIACDWTLGCSQQLSYLSSIYQGNDATCTRGR